VGKSVVCAALCRALLNRGIRVAPYKAQNMSNNSGVTPDGLEMGRAQIVQAEAAGIAPRVEMNPILLKPTSDLGSQVVLMGRVLDTRTASDYFQRKNELFATACDALNRLRSEYELVIMEGAGSCAEVNLMERDIVNLRMAEFADAPVILVADIHRGGVFAQIVGTLACLAPEKQARIGGFIINRFRGDLSLFKDGVSWIEEKTGKPVFGVLPWFHHFRIEAEDSVVIETPETVVPEKIRLPAVAVIRLPHISNFTDFDPLQAVAGLSVHYLETPRDLMLFSAVILPGSKNTRHDLSWLFESGWSRRIDAFAAKGGHVLGICGGYQMLGRFVHDPDGVEGAPGSTRGLSLLPVETKLVAPKTTSRTQFSWDGAQGEGYEIHMGQTERTGGAPFLRVTQQNGSMMKLDDGCVNDAGNIMGTYLHGLFDQPRMVSQWLESVDITGLTPSPLHGVVARDRDYDLLAGHFEAHVDMDRILKMVRC
jgi:adenosylcobyric acid synthase